MESNKWQGKRHVRTLVNRTARANVVAVCSSEPHELFWAREEYKNSGISVYSSYDEMLGHPGLQAVWVSTSTDVHARQTLAGIEKGLHVLCEKPLSTDMEEVRTGTDSRLICNLQLDAPLIFFQFYSEKAQTHAYKSNRLNQLSTLPRRIPS